MQLSLTGHINHTSGHVPCPGGDSQHEINSEVLLQTLSHIALPGPIFFSLIGVLLVNSDFMLCVFLGFFLYLFFYYYLRFKEREKGRAWNWVSSEDLGGTEREKKCNQNILYENNFSIK